MGYIKCAWNSVSSKTIINCFRHAGFTDGKETNTQEKNKAEPEIPTDLIVEAEKRGIMSAPLFKEYITMDNDLLTSEVPTDEDIITELSGENDVDINTSDEDPNPELEKVLALNEAAIAMKTMYCFLIGQDNALNALDNFKKWIPF
ncbi:hypothetical protein AVEN_210075-1 [Araneus ventricosus]|uniref:DDE-1 domain-containing protein n=1 Tax=Araneus ventricosus TaxID=182803 RepID=A0A4Y2PE24_ARAVE|nr:hypothetical protein AVEN_26148-1 [Araneus ventricosus]GBN48591.1 hypothetical protein AVEN_210075-1 [Araneus ventricosus]